jgi:hypothetical protein
MTTAHDPAPPAPATKKDAPTTCISGDRRGHPHHQGFLFPRSRWPAVGEAFVALIKSDQPVIFCTIVLGAGRCAALPVGKVGGPIACF